MRAGLRRRPLASVFSGVRTRAGPSPGGNKLSFALIYGRFLADAVERRRGCVNVYITPFPGSRG